MHQLENHTRSSQWKTFCDDDNDNDGNEQKGNIYYMKMVKEEEKKLLRWKRDSNRERGTTEVHRT